MSAPHLEQDSFWDLAALVTLPPDAQAHVEACADCRGELERTRVARSVLSATSEVPVLAPVAAGRVGAALAAAAEKELGKKPWWAPRGWLFAAGALAAVLLLVVLARQNQDPEPPAPIVLPAPKVDPTPLPPPTEVQKVEEPQLAIVEPPPKPAVKRTVNVTAAVGAKRGGEALAKATPLSEGDEVSTAKKGSLWMQLPDGSRAGLTASSKVQLTKLEDKAIGMELSQGSVVVMARHDPSRVLSVKAGEVEVIDVGTRFLVSRDVARVFVAVEEGTVDVKVPGETRTVNAGRAVTWREGELVEEAWAPTPVKKKTVAPIAAAPSVSPQQQTVAQPETPPILDVAPVVDAGSAPVAAADVAKPVPPAPVYPQAPVDPDAPENEWAAAPPKPVATDGGKASVAPVAPPVVAAPATQGAPAGEPEEVEEPDEGLLQHLERRVKGVGNLVQRPFKAAHASGRENAAKNIGYLTDEGRCDEALKDAQEWLKDKPSESADEKAWKRSVKVNQYRCYVRLHKDDDAAAVKKELDAK